MTLRLRAYLDLVRIPNVLTAVADIIAGFLYSGGGWSDWPILVRLACATACLYSGGVVLNDVCDAERDARERPGRPIPSGRVSRREALILAIVLLAAGLAIGASVSIRAAALTAALTVAIIVYDAVLKETPAAPALMGLCRALNLALGQCLAASFVSAVTIAPIAIMWLYTTSLTLFARSEAGRSTPRRLITGTVGLSLAVIGLAGLSILVASVHIEYLAGVALLLLTVGYRGIAAAAKPDLANVQQSVRIFVLSLILFDACLAWSACGWPAALLVAAILAPAVALGRLFRVT